MKEFDLWISAMCGHHKTSIVAIRSKDYILHISNASTKKKALAEAAKQLRELAKECDALAREK
jgi:hypothetical protein